MQRYSLGSLDTIPGSRRIGGVSGSRPITLRARPLRIGWHGGAQVFTGPTLSMINKTIVGRCRDFRPLCVRVVGLDDGLWTGC